MIKSMFSFLDANPTVKNVFGACVFTAFMGAVVGYALYMYNL